MDTTETADIPAVFAPISSAYMNVAARSDKAVMHGTGAGGKRYPPTRTPSGNCRWFPGLRPRERKAGAVI